MPRKEVKYTKTANSFSKVFPKWGSAFWRHCCLKHWCFSGALRWIVRGEDFRSKYKHYFTREMAEEFTRCSGGIIGLFFVVFCLIAGLQRRSIVKLSRLSWSTRLKRGSQQTPYTARFCSKLSSVRSPSLEACNFPIVLSRRFHRPIYFYFEFISNSDPRNLRPRWQVFGYFWIRNSQLFLSGCGFRPHASGEFESESGYF